MLEKDVLVKTFGQSLGNEIAACCQQEISSSLIRGQLTFPSKASIYLLHFLRRYQWVQFRLQTSTPKLE